MPAAARRVATLIAEGLVESAHDVSDGGVACAAAEMLIAGSSREHPIGAHLRPLGHDLGVLFAESPGTYLLEVRPENVDRVTGSADVHAAVIDMDARLTYAFVMNRMRETLMGDERVMRLAGAVFGAIQ